MNLADFLLSAQADLLVSSLVDDSTAAERQREVIGKRLADQFARLTAALEPEIVLEIGAHEADYAMSVKKSLPNARVVAFEAHPRVHYWHCDKVVATGVEYLPYCISAESGKTTLRVPMRPDPANPGEKVSMGSLLVDSNAREFTNYEVEAYRLDDFLGAETARRNVIWIDVEGAIGSVFDGADAALRSCVALYAEVETHPRWNGQITDVQVRERLTTYGLVPVLRDIQRFLYKKEWQYNVVYVRRELLGH